VIIAVALIAWRQFGGSDDGGAYRERPPAPVTLFDVETRGYSERIPALGTLQAWESVDIATSVSQLVSELLFEDGEQVEAGQVLARLRQDAEQASLSELQVRLADAEREVRRLEDLARRNQVAQTDLDSARTEVDVIRHQISEVRARIKDRTVVAPFAGVLGLREVSEGALVSAGQRLTTLDDITRMRLRFTVPERYLGELRVGQEIAGTTAAYNREFRGRLTSIDSRVDPVSRSVTARAVLPNDDRLLRPGMLMELNITTREEQVLMVPEESIESRGARHFVWTVDGDRAQRTEVQLGGRTPGWVVITHGIAEGQTVVRDGLVRLSGTSAAVRVVEG
jgi:membrane fusion protein (multidrug efflux system)